MKIIRNRYIPLPGYLAMNFFGVLFVRKGWQITDVGLRHERIHTMQMQEMLYVFFYIWYISEWMLRLIQYRSCKEAYYNISFEREAYKHQSDVNYGIHRKRYSFLKYIII